MSSSYEMDGCQDQPQRKAQGGSSPCRAASSSQAPHQAMQTAKGEKHISATPNLNTRHKQKEQKEEKQLMEME